jgi:hypothetical protein
MRRPLGRRRALVAALALSMLTPVAAVMQTQVAEAATGSCPGTQIASYPVTQGTLRMGTIYLYWDGSTGSNCAVDVAYGSFYGRSGKEMSVSLSACAYDASGICQTVGNVAYDHGQYLYYAGPVSVPAAGLCVQVYGQIDDSYYGLADGGSTGPVACG